MVGKAGMTSKQGVQAVKMVSHQTFRDCCDEAAQEGASAASKTGYPVKLWCATELTSRSRSNNNNKPTSTIHLPPKRGDKQQGRLHLWYIR